MSNIEKNILNAIGRGEVKMHSRWYFMLRALLLAAICVVFFLLLVCTVSMIMYVLQTNGAWTAVGLGIPGWYLFFRSLPLILVVLTLVFAVAIAALAQRYAIVYHQPVVYLLLVIAGLATAGSYLIPPAQFGHMVERYPVVGPFYQFEESAPSAVHRGVVVTFTNDGFILQDVDGETTSVVFATTSLGLGQTVIVFGDANASNTIRPFGMERVVPFIPAQQ